MGHKQSKVARPEGEGGPPPYSAKKEDSDGTRSNEEKTVEKTVTKVADPRQQPKKLKRCKRCGRHFLNENESCGNYHPYNITTRRTMLTRQGQPPIAATADSSQSAKYYDDLIWSCCLKHAYPSEHGGYRSTDGCMKHTGRHEAM